MDQAAIVRRIARTQRLVDECSQLFREAARDTPAIADAIQIARSEGLEEDKAWLFAAVRLCGQVRILESLRTIELAYAEHPVKVAADGQ